MAKWKQMKMIVGSIMVGALLMPTMSITAWANAETEVTVDNFESEILPNLAIKEDGTPLRLAWLTGKKWKGYQKNSLN